jgi:hypothetical protein
MKLLGVVLVLFAFTAGSMAQGDNVSCSYWNSDSPGANNLVDYFNTSYHVNGEHWMDAWETGTCTYQDRSVNAGSPCLATIRLFDTPTPGETGRASSFMHVLTTNTKGGASSSMGSPQATAQAATGVAACPFANCNLSVSLAGIVTVTPAPAFPVWGASDDYNDFCPAETKGCPIIIDTANEGFQLTNAADGVVTDMVIPGHPQRFGWTKRGSHNAFLWLDGHLFGNYTDQPASDAPSGFKALAVYDLNHDGVIDAKDAVFPNLRLWIDVNHDGIAQSSELFTLPTLGVYSISLHYQTEKYRDANGNLFRFRGRLQKAAPSEDRTIYDVFLTIN